MALENRLKMDTKVCWTMYLLGIPVDANKVIILGSIWDFQTNMSYRSSKGNVGRLDTFLEESKRSVKKKETESLKRRLFIPILGIC